jgi:uncharacterized membrane protein YukC
MDYEIAKWLVCGLSIFFVLLVAWIIFLYNDSIQNNNIRKTSLHKRFRHYRYGTFRRANCDENDDIDDFEII